MALLLVTFAVREESAFLHRFIGEQPSLKVRLTGIGKQNAEQAICGALAGETPDGVLTCGFAGGLDPALAAGAVVFSTDDDLPFSPALMAAGARPARFHCSDRIAITAREKHALREKTGADAVEMESGVIRQICRERGVPSATVRAISDAAGEDLPLDFNKLLNSNQRILWGRLAGALLRSPRSVGGLLQFHRRTRGAARRLAEVLAKVISDSAQARA